MQRIPLIIATAALALALAACDDPSTPMVDESQNPAAGGSIEPADKHLLGLTEAELPGDVRIARDGAEHYALTEDHVYGRRTVELDPGPDGVSRVTKVIVEVEDGVVVFD